MPCSGVHHGFMSCILVCVHVCVSVLVHGGTSGYFLSYSLPLTDPEALPIPPSPPPPAHFPPASIRNIKGVCFVSFYAYWCCLHVYLCPRYVSVEASGYCISCIAFNIIPSTQSPSLDLKLTDLTRLAGQWTPRIHLSPTPPPTMQASLALAAIIQLLHGAGDPNSGPHVCTASSLIH